MEGEVSFDSIRRVHLAEKSSPTLTKVDEEFYAIYRAHVGKLKEQLSTHFSLEAATAYESTRKLIFDVSRRRQQKIFFKALHDFQAGEISSDGLAREEKELYTSLIKLLSGYELQLAGNHVHPPAPASATASPPTIASDTVTVRILADLPQFVGASGPVGPFTAQSTANVSKQDAQLLAEQGVAQLI